MSIQPSTPQAQQVPPTETVDRLRDRLRATTALIDRVTEVAEAARARQDAAVRDALEAKLGWQTVQDETRLSARSVAFARDRANAPYPREVKRRGGAREQILTAEQVEAVLERIAQL